MKDEKKICIQCEKEFIVTALEKERLISRGFDIPKRCEECRRKKSKASNDDESRNPRDKRKRGREF